MMVPIVNGCPDLTEENQTLMLYREFLSLCERKFGVEGLVRRFDQRGELIFSPPYPLPKGWHVDEMLQDLLHVSDRQGISLVRRVIAEHLLGATIAPIDRLYSKLVTSVLCTRSEVTFVTLNFECLLDRVLVNQGGFDYLIQPNGIEDRWYVSRPQVKLLRLHGSLNWSTCQACGKLLFLFPHVRPDYYRHRLCPDCGGAVEPLIVVPHESPLSRLAPIWEAAQSALERADEVCIIGYSFPVYDAAVADLVGRSIRPSCRVKVVDKADHYPRRALIAELKGKYHRLLPGIDITYLVDGFEALV